MLGLFSGWLRGRILQSADNSGQVLVRFAGPFYDPMMGPSETLDIPVPRALVRSADSESEDVRHTEVANAHLWERRNPEPQIRRPLLSILLIRWWDYRVNARWSDFAVTNDGMLRDLVDGDGGVYSTLAGEFEMYCVFVKQSKDLEIVSENWAQAVLGGMNQVVWYFLWPCSRSDADSISGCVNEQTFFDMQQRMERAGLRSGWPHPLTLYRQLAGKTWIRK